MFAAGRAPPASAEVTKVDVGSRTDIGGGYEQVVGRIHFAVDPKNPRNAVIADIDKAPRNAAGLVEFSSDFSLQRPVSGGNGAALIDVVNRGGTTALRLNRSTRPGDAADDGLLRKMGVMVMAVGWEFDVPARNGAIRIEVPVATENGAPITGIVRATFTPNNKDASFTVGDLASYAPVDANGADTVLTVRDRMSDRTGQPVPRDKWKLAGNVVTMTGGFEPGRNYEIAYRAANPPVSGLGLAAVRDAATWLKHTPDALAPVKYVYALGVSQSGRFLRDYLYEGFNTDEKQRQVFDGMMVHIAGASQLDLNRRWATPTGLGQYDATLVSVRGPRAEGRGERRDRRPARQRPRAEEPAEDLLHEHRRGVLGRRAIGRARPHDRGRHDRPDDSGERPRVLLRRQPARAGGVSAGGRRGTAEGQPDRLLVEHARAVRGDGQMGEGGRGAAAEPDSAPVRRDADESRRTSRSRRCPACRARRR